MGRERRARRYWSDEEKRRIVAQARVPGGSVSQVARRYDVNANLVFKWLRDPRYCAANGAPNDAAGDDGLGPSFLPVEIVTEPSALLAERAPADRKADGTIEIVLSTGDRLTISGGFDPDAVSRLVRSLSARVRQ